LILEGEEEGGRDESCEGETEGGEEGRGGKNIGRGGGFGFESVVWVN